VDLEFQKLISHSVTRWLSLYPSLPVDASNVTCFKIVLHVHRQANCCSETFFWKFSARTLFKTLRYLQSFLVAFNEQVQNIEKSKHQLLRLHRVSPLWRQGFNRDNQMYLSSQVKSALRKLRDWEKAKIVTVYYSCQMYLYCTSVVLHIWLNGPLYLLNSNVLARLLGLQTTEWENVSYVSGTCLRETFLLMKLNCFTNIKTCLSSYKKSINHMQFIVKWWNMKDGQKILQLAIPLNASENW